MKKTILLLFTLVVGCSSPYSNQSRVVQQFFDMDDQLQNVELNRCLDGGTISLEITDIHGNKTTICIDNEAFGILIDESERDLPETVEYINQKKQKCIYLGVIHPSFKGAEKIEYHSDLEASVLKRIELLKEKNPLFKEEFSQFIETTQSERHLTIKYE